MAKEDNKLRKQSLEKNLGNARTEQTLILSALSSQKERNDLAKQFNDIRAKMHPIAMKNYRYINPTYAFQLEDEYIVLQKEMSELESKMDSLTRETKYQEGVRAVERYKEQLESIEKSIGDLEKQISELGE